MLNKKRSLTEKARLRATTEEILDHLEEYKHWWRRNGKDVLKAVAEGNFFAKISLQQILARRSSCAAIFRHLS